jgi:hypothetical protein
MSFQNTQKQEHHEHHPVQTGRQWLRNIRTIYRLKLVRILLILLLLTVILFALSIWSKTLAPPQFAWLQNLPLESLATSCLGVVLIGFAFEWSVRNEAEQQLRHVLNEHFQNQVAVMSQQIPSAMLTTPEVMKNILAPDVVDGLIRTGLEIRLENAQLAREAYDSFLSHLLNHGERRSNYRCSMYLTSITSSNLPDEIARKYYDASIDVRYDTILQKDIFRFVCVDSMDEYNELLKDPAWELRWMSKPVKAFSREAAFQVESVHVGDLQLNIRREDSNGKNVIVADHLELQSLQGKMVTVYYRYKVKVKKRGHLLMEHVPCPTHNVVVELDYTHTDIDFVNVLDFFVSKTKPAIRYIPSRQKPQRIQVEVNEWVFPKGGVVFVWVLNAEKHPNFWRLSSAENRRSNRSRTGPGITGPLPDILPE